MQEKIMQIMEKNEVEFVSAEFSARLLGSSGYESGVVWCKPMSGAVPI